MTDTSNKQRADTKTYSSPTGGLGECDPQNLDKKTFFMLILASFPATRSESEIPIVMYPPRVYWVLLIF